MDKAPVCGHLRSVRLVVNVLNIAAEPAFLLQVNAKLPQKLPEILLRTRIVRGQLLPHNLTVFDQVCRDHIRRVISSAEATAQVATLNHACHADLVEYLNPSLDYAEIVLYGAVRPLRSGQRPH